MQAITPLLHASTADIRLATLHDLLAAGQAAHPDLASRMDKAAALLVTRKVECGESGRLWYVQSETSPDQEYTVTPRAGIWHCTCQDHARRADWCKHALAVALLRRCAERQPAPAADPDAPIPFTLTPKALALLARGDRDRLPVA